MNSFTPNLFLFLKYTKCNLLINIKCRVYVSKKLRSKLSIVKCQKKYLFFLVVYSLSYQHERKTHTRWKARHEVRRNKNKILTDAEFLVFLKSLILYISTCYFSIFLFG